MIHIVIGQSGSGKTTFCKDKFLKEPAEVKQDIVTITICKNNHVGIGAYFVGKRCEGTDTLAYNAQDKIVQQVRKLCKEGRDVVLEGDRITTANVLKKIEQIDTEKRLYLITCSITASMARLKAAGSQITRPFVKTTKTKARRLYLEFGSKFNGTIINTEDTWKS